MNGCASVPASRPISKYRSSDLLGLLRRTRQTNATRSTHTSTSAGLHRSRQSWRHRLGSLRGLIRVRGQRPQLVAAERRGVVDHPDRQWRAKAPHLNLAPGENIEHNTGCCPDDVRYHQLAIVFLGEVLQSRGDVDGLAYRGHRRVRAIAEGADDDLAAMNADADLERLL